MVLSASLGSLSSASASHPPSAVARAAAAPKPLAGRTIVIDAGHQLGNSRFPSEINKPVNAGGFKKPCNTTGTATNRGYPEATFAYNVAKKLKRKLTRLGATVILTRSKNSRALWGPCVNVRGKLGNKGYRGLKHAADLKISIHGDGASSASHGFHVIVPENHRIAKTSKRYGKATRAALRDVGFRRANYIAGGTGLVARGDLGTLNLSKIPTAMVELGNMRNSHDAHVMKSKKGQKRYAHGLLLGIRDFVGE